MEFIRNSGRGLGMGENIITLALAPDKKKSGDAFQIFSQMGNFNYVSPVHSIIIAFLNIVLALLYFH